MPFKVGQRYTRRQVQELLGVPRERRRGAWETGYNRFDDAVYVFCNIGAAGRTGHDYDNRWEGDELVWYAKSGTNLQQPLIRAMADGTVGVNVFWRSDNKDTSFLFEGTARALEVAEGPPVRFRWAFPLDVAHGTEVKSSKDQDVRRMLTRLADAMRQRIAASGSSRMTVRPTRSGPQRLELLETLTEMWSAQAGRCPLCRRPLPVEPLNPLLQPSPDRIESADKTYGAHNLHLVHLGCNLAKRDATLGQWFEFLAHLRSSD